MKKPINQKFLAWLELETFDAFGEYFCRGIVKRLSIEATTEKANIKEDYSNAVQEARKDCYVLHRYKSLLN